MDTIEYDVVIVGSGIAGAIMAKTLTDAGKTVLLLEAGLEAGKALEGEPAFTTYQGYLNRFYQAAAKSPNSPYPAIANAPSADAEGYLIQEGDCLFGSDNLIAAGGTTMHWLGTTLRMLPNDFKMHSKYGVGMDWPIAYDALRDYYEMAEFEIGVAGNTADQDIPNMGGGFFSAGYRFPMKGIPQSYMDKKFVEQAAGTTVALDGENYALKFCSTPQGRNSIPDPGYAIAGVAWDAAQRKLVLRQRGGTGARYEPVGSLWDPYTGQRCEGSASCVPICPVQAKYNALKTLKKAQYAAGPRLKILAQAVAYDLIIDPMSGDINGIRYKRYSTDDTLNYTTHVARGKVYVLAASAIENAKLLLASNAANSSDQVGRNLMDHLCLLTWGLFPEKVYPFRGPGSTTNISTFRDGDFRKDHAPWIVPLDNWGWGWPEFSPGTDVEQAVDNGIFGADLRRHLNNRLTRQVLLHFECEQDPQPENRVTISPNHKDALDNYKPVIRYNVSDYVRKAFEAATSVSDQIFKASGIEPHTRYFPKEQGYVTYNGVGYTYRGAGHIVGTHRMGSDKKTSVVDLEQRCWDHRNLFLAGCGNMPTLGTSNPTLTMAALTFMAAEAILKQLHP